jgi:TetR/AcrR family transcriptional repressor of nem operon
MSPGPRKSFDPDLALERARDVFWRRGYDGAALSALEAAMGIGRKSLYDTFGSKRELFLRALEHYGDTVIRRICEGLEDPRGAPLENLGRVLHKLQRHHASPQSHGCLLGVAMAQADPRDVELAAALRAQLARLEDAFARTFRRARADGALSADARPRELARAFVGLTQGMALVGRVTATSAVPRSMVRAALQSLAS